MHMARIPQESHSSISVLPPEIVIRCVEFSKFGELCIPGTKEIFVDHALTLKSSAQQENLVLAQYAPDSPEYRWIHANYPRCCNHLDCKPATVKWTPQGWEVLGADHLVAEKDAIPWPFGEPFACMVGGRVRCLFLNSGG